MNQKEQEREWNQEDMAKYEKWLQEEVELREVSSEELDAIVDHMPCL